MKSKSPRRKIAQGVAYVNEPELGRVFEATKTYVEQIEKTSVKHFACVVPRSDGDYVRVEVKLQKGAVEQ